MPGVVLPVPAPIVQCHLMCHWWHYQSWAFQERDRKEALCVKFGFWQSSVLHQSAHTRNTGTYFLNNLHSCKETEDMDI